jgi:hypothetical protein
VLAWLGMLTQVCNDGSTGGVYLRLSPTNSTTWVLFQEGGGWCTTKAGCQVGHDCRLALNPFQRRA